MLDVEEHSDKCADEVYEAVEREADFGLDDAVLDVQPAEAREHQHLYGDEQAQLDAGLRAQDAVDGALQDGLDDELQHHARDAVPHQVHVREEVAQLAFVQVRVYQVQTDAEDEPEADQSDGDSLQEGGVGVEVGDTLKLKKAEISKTL